MVDREWEEFCEKGRQLALKDNRAPVYDSAFAEGKAVVGGGKNPYYQHPASQEYKDWEAGVEAARREMYIFPEDIEWFRGWPEGAEVAGVRHHGGHPEIETFLITTDGQRWQVVNWGANTYCLGASFATGPLKVLRRDMFPG